MVDEERRRTAAAAPIPPDEFDLTNTFALFDNLHASGSGHASDGDYDAHDGRPPPGMQPEYRDAEAMQQAEEQEDEEELNSQQAPYVRNRSLDDE